MFIDSLTTNSGAVCPIFQVQHFCYQFNRRQLGIPQKISIDVNTINFV